MNSIAHISYGLLRRLRLLAMTTESITYKKPNSINRLCCKYSIRLACIMAAENGKIDIQLDVLHGSLKTHFQTLYAGWNRFSDSKHDPRQIEKALTVTDLIENSLTSIRNVIEKQTLTLSDLKKIQHELASLGSKLNTFHSSMLERHSNATVLWESLDTLISYTKKTIAHLDPTEYEAEDKAKKERKIQAKLASKHYQKALEFYQQAFPKHYFAPKEINDMNNAKECLYKVGLVLAAKDTQPYDEVNKLKEDALQSIDDFYKAEYPDGESIPEHLIKNRSALEQQLEKITHDLALPTDDSRLNESQQYLKTLDNAEVKRLFTSFEKEERENPDKAASRNTLRDIEKKLEEAKKSLGKDNYKENFRSIVKLQSYAGIQFLKLGGEGSLRTSSQKEVTSEGPPWKKRATSGQAFQEVRQSASEDNIANKKKRTQRMKEIIKSSRRMRNT